MAKKKDKGKTEPEKADEEEEGITEAFLGSIPLFGGFFKQLGKTEVFQKRFKETDEQIKENLRTGERKKVIVDTHFSIRPLVNEVRREIKVEKEKSPDIEVGEDYVYGWKGKTLTVAVKVPKKDADIGLQGKNLIITSGKSERKLELPGYFRHIKKKQYKKGMWLLELTR